MQQHASAACSTLPSSMGTVTFTVNAPSDASYRLWAHVYTPTSANDATYLRVDQSYCQITLGNSNGMPAGQFTWVDYQNGTTSNKINLSLSSGNHTFTFAGLDPSVGVDKIVLTADQTCVPSGDGTNCTNTSSAPGTIITPPPTSGSPTPAVTGTVSLPGAANGSAVKYYLNGTPVEGTQLDTTKLQDGTYTLKRVETDANGQTKEVEQKIVVDNHKTLAERIHGIFKLPATWAGIAGLLFVGAAFALRQLRPRMFAQAVQWLQTKILRKPYIGALPATQGTVVYTSHFSHAPHVSKRALAIGSGVIVTLIGVIVFYTFAATNSASYLVWNGSTGNGATVVSKSDAIGGKMVQFAASAPTPPPAPTPTPTPTPTPPPTGSCATSTTHVPDGPDGMGGCWPGPSNTGPSASEASMATYTGSCTITAANTVIDSKVINCSPLNVGNGASGLMIKNSYIKGGVISNGSATFTIQDSVLDNAVSYPACSSPSSCAAGKYACGDPNNATTECGVGYRNFTILRTEIMHTNRAAYCESTCTIQDSYFHGTTLWPDHTNLAHASSVRNEQYLTLKHNALGCDYTGPFDNDELGCSADMSGYPDFAPIMHATIDGNLFLSNNAGAGFCIYGGGTAGKPYSGNANNATYIVIQNNVFQRGANGKCGTYGPVTDFIQGRTGNVWSNNKYDNGTTVSPA
jgi:hypothetical protein